MRTKREFNNFKLLKTIQWSWLPREIFTNTRSYFLTLQQLQSRKPGTLNQTKDQDETLRLQQSWHSSWRHVAASVLFLFPRLRVSYKICTAGPHQSISWSFKSHGFGFKNKQTIKKMKSHFKGCQFLHITGDDLLRQEISSRSDLAFRNSFYGSHTFFIRS